MQVPWVQQTLPPGKRVGVVTISSENLTPAHFEAVAAPVDTPFIGTEGDTEFSKSITGGSHRLNVAAGHELMNRHPTIGVLVLECTSMVPYPRDLHLALGVLDCDIITLLTRFQAGLRPRRFTLCAPS